MDWACAASGAKCTPGQALSRAETCSFSSASERAEEDGALILAHAHCRSTCGEGGEGHCSVGGAYGVRPLQRRAFVEQGGVGSVRGMR